MVTDPKSAFEPQATAPTTAAAANSLQSPGVPALTGDPIAELEARRLQLGITIHNLSFSHPQILKHIVTVALALTLFLAALTAAILHYVNANFPPVLSTIGAFATVVLAYWLYVSYRAFAIESEKRERYKVTLEKTKSLAKLADELLAEERRPARTGG